MQFTVDVEFEALMDRLGKEGRVILDSGCARSLGTLFKQFNIRDSILIARDKCNGSSWAVLGSGHSLSKVGRTRNSVVYELVLLI